MKVKMLTLLAGPGGVFQAGSVVEVTRETGAALIAGKYAEAVAEVKPMEATWKPTETTDAPAAAEQRKRPAARRGGK